MKYLVFCVCGHALDVHRTGGCDGEGGACRCRRDEYTALEAAVAQARSHPWGRGPENATDRRSAEASDG